MKHTIFLAVAIMAMTETANATDAEIIEAGLLGSRETYCCRNNQDGRTHEIQGEQSVFCDDQMHISLCSEVCQRVPRSVPWKRHFSFETIIGATIYLPLFPKSRPQNPRAKTMSSFSIRTALETFCSAIWPSCIRSTSHAQAL